MKKALVVFLFVWMMGAGARAQTRRLTFEGTHPIQKFELKDLGPNFPSDWSTFDYLVLEMRTSTPQRFHLIIQD